LGSTKGLAGSKLTSIAVLAAADQRAPSAVYLLSDSRLVWSGGKAGAWDHGRKTFFSRNTPDVFAFCGDALFPSMVLPQVVDLLDAQFAVPVGASFDARFDALQGFLSLAVRSYPVARSAITILHAGRDNSGMTSKFRVGALAWSAETSRWRRRLIDTPQRGSGLLLPHGSSTPSIRRALSSWQGAPQADTSRAAFRSFVQALKSELDPSSGGPPQMVGV
jgi:hypothetical protein